MDHARRYRERSAMIDRYKKNILDFLITVGPHHTKGISKRLAIPMHDVKLCLDSLYLSGDVIKLGVKQYFFFNLLWFTRPYWFDPETLGKHLMSKLTDNAIDGDCDEQ